MSDRFSLVSEHPSQVIWVTPDRRIIPEDEAFRLKEANPSDVIAESYHHVGFVRDLLEHLEKANQEIEQLKEELASRLNEHIQ